MRPDVPPAISCFTSSTEQKFMSPGMECFRHDAAVAKDAEGLLPYRADFGDEQIGDRVKDEIERFSGENGKIACIPFNSA